MDFRIQPNGPDHIGGQRLGCFGPIYRDRAQAEQAEAGFGYQFAPFIRVQKGAVFEVELAGGAARHDVLEPIQNIYPGPGFSRVDQPCAADEAEAIAAEPAITKGDREIVVDLFEYQFVAFEVFVEVAADAPF